MTHKPINAQCLFRELLGVVGEYTHRYYAHLEDNDELLPYVLMDDFSRFVIECQSSGDHDVFERCIRFLNECFTFGDDDVRLLVQSTFAETVETLWNMPDHFSAIYNSLVPDLQRTIRTFN
ncbi:MAG: hypothetical protein KDB14_05795 [Planctomycetales bacterium]|nr:hypothetical protein [Planctomycetales bacterium]